MDRCSAGWSDLIAEHPSGVWIFELKVDASAEAALAQIKEKNYAAPRPQAAHLGDRPQFRFEDPRPDSWNLL